MRTKFPRGIVSNQTTGNIGLFFVCYKLSQYGWNVMPTARNAKGVDIVAYSQNGARVRLIQVKTLSNRDPVGLGKRLDDLIAEWMIIYVKFCRKEQRCFVLRTSEVKKLAVNLGENERASWWLSPKRYDTDAYEGDKGGWGRIGQGVP
ncbi:MAG: hypothetical protein ABSG14_02530 [Verrucomicrobiia bacterium]|jgi:hypothetical protein